MIGCGLMKKKIKKNKEYKRLKSSALSFLANVPDENLSSLAGIQDTMNQFLNSQGLPSVGIPGLGVSSDYVPETRSFEEIENDLKSL